MVGSHVLLSVNLHLSVGLVLRRMLFYSPLADLLTIIHY